MVQDPFRVSDKHGIQALTENAILQRPFGYAVITGCNVEVADGFLNPDDPNEDTLRVTAGSALVDGTTYDVSKTHLDLSASDDDPRWDLVYLAPDGTLAVEEGAAEPADPPHATNEDPETVERPAPPDTTALTDHSNGTPLGLAWVPGGATAIDQSMVFDRRVPANHFTPQIDYDDTFALRSTVSDVDTLTADTSGVTIPELDVGSEWMVSSHAGVTVNSDQSKPATHATTEDITLYVDPANGSDSNDGTSANPLKTLNEAIGRVPKNIYHSVAIYLRDGDYTGEGHIYLQNFFVANGNNPEFEIIGHHPDHPDYSSKAPSNVTLPKTDEAGTTGSEGFYIKGVEFQEWVQGRDSHARFVDCNFRYGSDPSGSGTARGFTGYLQRNYFQRCEFINLDTCVTVTSNAQITLAQCSATSGGGTVPDTPFESKSGSIVTVKGGTIIDDCSGTPDHGVAGRSFNYGGVFTADDGRAGVTSNGLVTYGSFTDGAGNTLYDYSNKQVPAPRVDPTVTPAIKDSDTLLDSTPTAFDFDSNISVTDEGGGEYRVDASGGGGSGGSGSGSTLTSGTIALSGNTNPAFDGTVSAGLSETDNFVVTIAPDSVDQTSANYAFNHEYGLTWDESTGDMDINLTVNWDVDPGTNLNATWQAWESGAPSQVAAGTVTLTSGTATVSTGLTDTDVDVALDPSGGGSNTADVKVAGRAAYDSGSDAIAVEIIEDGTSVGNPDVGYTIIKR